MTTVCADGLEMMGPEYEVRFWCRRTFRNWSVLLMSVLFMLCCFSGAGLSGLCVRCLVVRRGDVGFQGTATLTCRFSV